MQNNPVPCWLIHAALYSKKFKNIFEIDEL